jgi:hypothetical protein
MPYPRTFQESLFARRLLVFNGTVTWICGRCTWYESDDFVQTPDLHPDTAADVEDWPAERPHLGVPMGMMSLIPKLPRLGRWGMLVANFSSRDLTYETGVTRALAGATEVMGTTFPGGIIYGLPAFFFDIALLWQPKFEITRRRGEPSWSWLGWKGAVVTLRQWPLFIAGLYRKVYIPEDWLEMARLKPVANYQILAAGGSHSYLATTKLNGFYEYQALRANTNAHLPEVSPKARPFRNTVKAIIIPSH